MVVLDRVVVHGGSGRCQHPHCDFYAGWELSSHDELVLVCWQHIVWAYRILTGEVSG